MNARIPMDKVRSMALLGFVMPEDWIVPVLSEAEEVQLTLS
jgi:hypothetical protein